jgi:hypothetical protein
MNDGLFLNKNSTMKLSFFIGMMALLVWACSPVKEAAKTSAGSRLINESLLK